MQRLWAEIREEFETTDIGLRALAKKYGIKSHATIKRRVDSENWRRDVPSVAAHIATQNVLQSLENEPALGGSQGGSSPPVEQPPESQNHAEKIGETVKSEVVEKGGSQGGSSPPFKPTSLAISEQVGAIRAARRMATAQEQQLLREIELANATIGISASMIQMLNTAITTEDPAEATKIISRFKALGGKMESFSSLLKAALAGVEKGVAMRRKALGMEPRGGIPAPGAGAAGQAELPEQVQQMLPALSTEQLMELRRTAAMLNEKMRLAQPQAHITIDAEIAEAAINS